MRLGKAYDEVLDMPYIIALRQFYHFRLHDEICRLKMSMVSGMHSEESLAHIKRVVEEAELKLYCEDPSKATEIVEKIQKRISDANADAVVGYLTGTVKTGQYGGVKVRDER